MESAQTVLNPLPSILLFLFTLPIAWASTCPQVTCIPLDLNVCAHKNSAGSLFLSSTPCTPPMSCSVQSIFPNWWTFASVGSNVYCEEPEDMDVPGNSSFTPVKCLEKAENKEFSSGESTVECSGDEDCKLADGSVVVGSCRCSFRGSGRGLCLPHPSNPIFSGYWSLCLSTGSLTQRRDYDYWTFYMSYFPYLHSDIPCVSTLYESTLADTLLKEMIEGRAGRLVVGVALWGVVVGGS